MALSIPAGTSARIIVDDVGTRTDKMRVDLPTDTYVTIRLFTMFVEPGDTLLITGEVNLTNHTGRSLSTGAVTGKRYPVGVATSLWIYDANAPAAERPATWKRLGTNGENATVDGHHIQQGLTRPFVVPSTWDPTHQIGIVLRVDVHSTGWDDNTTPDYILVEDHGVLMAVHYPALDPLHLQLAQTASQVASLGAAMSGYETALAGLQDRLSALEAASAPTCEPA